LITSRAAARKATEMFCVNMKVLLFEDEEYKRPIFKNYNIGKNESLYVKN
jgi:hypothetical protein